MAKKQQPRDPKTGRYIKEPEKGPGLLESFGKGFKKGYSGDKSDASDEVSREKGDSFLGKAKEGFKKGYGVKSKEEKEAAVKVSKKETSSDKAIKELSKQISQFSRKLDGVAIQVRRNYQDVAVIKNSVANINFRLDNLERKVKDIDARPVSSSTTSNTPQKKDEPQSSGGFDISNFMKRGGKQAAQTTAKTTAKEVAKTAGKKAGKAAVLEAVKKSGAKLASSAAKKIPGVAIVAGLGFAAWRLISDGDVKGAAGEIASGVASTVPGAGTAASVAVDIGLMARDIYHDLYGMWPEDDDDSSERMDEIKSVVSDWVSSTFSSEDPTKNKDKNNNLSESEKKRIIEKEMSQSKPSYDAMGNYTGMGNYEDKKSSKDASKVAKDTVKNETSDDYSLKSGGELTLTSQGILSLRSKSKILFSAPNDKIEFDSDVIEFTRQGIIFDENGMRYTKDRKGEQAQKGQSQNQQGSSPASPPPGGPSSSPSAPPGQGGGAANAPSGYPSAGRAGEQGAASQGIRRGGGVPPSGGATGAPMPGGEGLGQLSAKYESGKRGSAAIGFDRTGGTSYGKYQIASRTGTMNNFMTFLKDNNPEAYERLSKAGNPDAGKGGAFAQEWSKLAAEGKLGDSEHAFIKQSHYDKGVAGVKNQNLQGLIGNSKALQEVMWSTSVQHGAGGASKIFNKVYKEGMSEQDLIKSIYAERSTKFGSSTPEVRASVMRRFQDEQQGALGMVGQPADRPGGPAGPSGDGKQMAALPPTPPPISGPAPTGSDARPAEQAAAAAGIRRQGGVPSMGPSVSPDARGAGLAEKEKGFTVNNGFVTASSQSASNYNQCASLSKAFNRGVGAASSWKVDRDPSAIQPGMMIASTKYGTGPTPGGAPGAGYHTGIAISKPDKQGNLLILDQWAGASGQAQVRKVNIYDKKLFGGQAGVVQGTKPSLEAIEFAKTAKGAKQHMAEIEAASQTVAQSGGPLAPPASPGLLQQAGQSPEQAKQIASLGENRNQILSSIRSGLPAGASQGAVVARDNMLKSEERLRALDPNHPLLPENAGKAPAASGEAASAAVQAAEKQFRADAEKANVGQGGPGFDAMGGDGSLAPAGPQGPGLSQRIADARAGLDDTTSQGYMPNQTLEAGGRGVTSSVDAEGRMTTETSEYAGQRRTLMGSEFLGAMATREGGVSEQFLGSSSTSSDATGFKGSEVLGRRVSGGLLGFDQYQLHQGGEQLNVGSSEYRKVQSLIKEGKMEEAQFAMAAIKANQENPMQPTYDEMGNVTGQEPIKKDSFTPTASMDLNSPEMQKAMDAVKAGPNEAYDTGSGGFADSLSTGAPTSATPTATGMTAAQLADISNPAANYANETPLERQMREIEASGKIASGSTRLSDGSIVASGMDMSNYSTGKGFVVGESGSDATLSQEALAARMAANKQALGRGATSIEGAAPAMADLSGGMDIAGGGAMYSGATAERVETKPEQKNLEEIQKVAKETEEAQNAAIKASSDKEQTKEDTKVGNTSHHTESSPPSPGNDGYGDQKQGGDLPSICTI